LFCRNRSASVGVDKTKGIFLLNFSKLVRYHHTISSIMLQALLRGVAIFAKACFGHPSPSKQQKLNVSC
jgi:hypothetical protein